MGLHDRPSTRGADRQARGHTRLFPLGSPGAMDLLFALDDRVQDLTLDPAAVAPIGTTTGRRHRLAVE